MSFLKSMNPHVVSVLLLVLSNCFMTFAWYGLLFKFLHKSWWIAALAGWGIALFEYLFMVPANRIGVQVYTVPELKIIQEVVSLTVFIPFAIFYLHQPFKWDFVWAALCLVGAVYFLFR